MQNATIFELAGKYKNKRKMKSCCRNLISKNILNSRADFIESSLRNYEKADRYPNFSEESDDYKINAKLESLIADDIAHFNKILPSIKSLKIIKRGGFWKPSFFTPKCNKCDNNMTGIEAEVIIEDENEKQIGNVKLFYFCNNCGNASRVREGF